jgi:hypothetical protein
MVKPRSIYRQARYYPPMPGLSSIGLITSPARVGRSAIQDFGRVQPKPVALSSSM